MALVISLVEITTVVRRKTSKASLLLRDETRSPKTSIGRVGEVPERPSPTEIGFLIIWNRPKRQEKEGWWPIFLNDYPIFSPDIAWLQYPKYVRKGIYTSSIMFLLYNKFLILPLTLLLIVYALYHKQNNMSGSAPFFEAVEVSPFFLSRSIQHTHTVTFQPG